MATSAATEPVTNGVLRNTLKPTVKIYDGKAEVGEQVRLGDRGEWSVGSVSRSYQWFADGQEIPGMTDTSHRFTADHVGKKLSVRETATKPGFEPVSVMSDETVVVITGTIGFYSNLKINGWPIVGRPLTVTEPTNKTYTCAYQWLADGVEIPGVNGTVFTPTDAQLGKALTVRATASEPGYNDAELTSIQSVTVVEPGFYHVSGSAPEVLGTPRVGQMLSIDRNFWSPNDGVTFSHEWLADGVAIPGADASTFKLTNAEAGKKISVQLTGSVPGFTPDSKVSAETAPVTTSTPFGAPHDFKSPGGTVTTVDLGWTKVEGAVKYRIYYGIGTGKRTKVEVGNVTATALKGLKANTAYSIDIAALKADGTRSAYSPHINATTTAFNPPTDLVSPNATATTIDVTWTKAPGAVKYRLYYGIGAGKRTKIEVGDVSGLTIKGLKSRTTYTIDVSAFTASGVQSAYTARIPVTTD